MVLPVSNEVPRASPYSGAAKAESGFGYGAVTLCGGAFQLLSLPYQSHIAVLQPQTDESDWFGLIPVRSPLLRESRLISFPPGTEMFHFPGFALQAYEFSMQ